MRSWARLISIALLLAVPLQGFAAASRIACGEHVPSRQSSATAHQASGHDHAAHARGADAAHGGTVLAGVTAGEALAPTSNADAVPGTCAYCAICCVGAALVDWAGQLVAPRPAQADFLAQPLVACPQPFDGPERPPRTF